MIGEPTAEVLPGQNETPQVPKTNVPPASFVETNTPTESLSKQELLKPSRFQTEEELYEATIVGYDKFIDPLKENPVITRSLANEGQPVYTEKQSGNRHLYFVGENHFSRESIDFIHRELAPKIRQNPNSWIILREGDRESTELLDGPSTFYVQELSALFNVPHEDALADIYSLDTRRYIFETKGVSERDIDRIFTSQILGAYSREIRGNNRNLPDHVVDRMVIYLRKPKDYVLALANELLQKPPEPDFEEKADKVIEGQNNYSKMRLHEILKKYPERTNVLISAGYRHLPIIE